MAESARQYGEIVHYRFGPTHAYLLTNPAYAHYVLVERADKFAARSQLIRALNSAFGHELFPPKERAHRAARPQPLFQPRWLDEFAATTTGNADALAQRWNDDSTHDVAADFRRLTLGIAARMLFNTTATDVANRIAETMVFCPPLSDRRFRSPLTLPDWVPTAGNRRDQLAAHELKGLIDQLIQEHRAYPNTPDLLGSLIAAADARGATDTQVRDEALTLFLAAHETTATTLAWALYLLAQNSEAETLLRAEVDAVLEGRAPTAEDLPDLPYAEMVVRETLRLYPPAWLLARQAKSEIRIANYYLPSGSTVFVSPYIMHRSPRYFVTPSAFIPERFAEGYERRLPRNAYLPFGAGARAGIEQDVTLTQTTLLLATLVQRCRFSLDPARVVNAEPGLTLRPSGGMTMRVEARTPAVVTV